MKTKLILALTLSVLAANTFAADGYDRTGSAAYTTQAAVASDGYDHTGSASFASDGSDHTGAAKLASDGFDHTGAAKVAARSVRRCRSSWCRSPQLIIERDFTARLRSGLVVSGAIENRLKTQHVVKKAIFWLFFEQKNCPPKFMKKNLHPRHPAKAL